MTLKNIKTSALVAFVVFAIAGVLLYRALVQAAQIAPATVGTTGGSYAAKPLLVGVE